MSPDLTHLHAALAQARAAELAGEVPIGAVLTHEGQIKHDATRKAVEV